MSFVGKNKSDLVEEDLCTFSLFSLHVSSLVTDIVILASHQTPMNQGNTGIMFDVSWFIQAYSWAAAEAAGNYNASHWAPPVGSGVEATQLLHQSATCTDLGFKT